MIIQGRNEPIVVEFDKEPIDVSITLRNEIQELKHWDKVDLEHDADYLVFSAPISQEESMTWEEGRCWVEVKWTEEDDDGNVIAQFARAKDWIRYWMDDTVLALEADDADLEVEV